MPVFCHPAGGPHNQRGDENAESLVKIGENCILTRCVRSQAVTITKMAGVAGLEPVTSAVTGQRSNQLSYTPAMGDGTIKNVHHHVKFWFGNF